MALPLLPILLLLGGGATVAALVAAKNVKGEDVKLGQRSMDVSLLSNDGDVVASSVMRVTPNSPSSTLSGKWAWLIPDWNAQEAPFAEGLQGVEQTRKQAFNSGLVTLMTMDNVQLGAPASVHPASSALRIDFYNNGAEMNLQTEGWGEALIFRVTIVPTDGGWFMQVTDPRATVAFMQTLPSRSAAISAAYGFVEKAGY